MTAGTASEFTTPDARASVSVQEGTNRQALIWLTLALLLVAAFVLRIVGLRNDFPSIDESYHMLLSMRVASGHDVGWYGYPSVIYYVGAAAMGVKYAFDLLSGNVHSAAQFGQSFLINPVPMIRWLHVVTALANIAAIFVTFLAGRALRGVFVGLLAAAFLVIWPGPVYWGTQFWPEGIILLPSALCIYYCIRYWRGDPFWNLLLAALFAGLATSTKYNAVYLCAQVAAFCIWREDRVPVRRWAAQLPLLALTSIAGFLAGTPGFLKASARQSFIEVRTRPEERFGLEPGKWLHESDFYLDWWWKVTGKIAPFLLLAVLVALIVLAVKSRRLGIVMAVSIAAPVPLICWYWSVEWYHLLPIVPTVAIAVAVAFDLVLREPGRWRRVTAISLLVLWSAFSLKASLDHVVERRRPDSRVLSRQWIESHIPDGARIAMDGGSVPVLVRTHAQAEQMLSEVRAKTPDKGGVLAVEASIEYYPRRYWIRTLDIPTDTVYVRGGWKGDPAALLAGVPSVQQLKESGFSYLVLTDDMYGRYARSKKFQNVSNYYAGLFRSGEVVFDTGRLRDVRGPRISVIRIKSGRIDERSPQR